MSSRSTRSWPLPRPGLGEAGQLVDVDFGVDGRRGDSGVSKDLADLAKGGTRRSIFVASECRSRCAPALGIPTLSQAAYTTPVILTGLSAWTGAIARRNTWRLSVLGRPRRR